MTRRRAFKNTTRPEIADALKRPQAPADMKRPIAGDLHAGDLATYIGGAQHHVRQMLGDRYDHNTAPFRDSLRATMRAKKLDLLPALKFIVENLARRPGQALTVGVFCAVAGDLAEERAKTAAQRREKTSTEPPAPAGELDR